MSLHEVYNLAHTAECRLELSANRPDRDLRIVVGHLLHYESLRLRIVEIEHEAGKRERALGNQSHGGSDTQELQLERDPSSNKQGTPSTTPLPPHSLADEVEDDSDEDEDEDEDPLDQEGGDGLDDGLDLTRFGSGRSGSPVRVVDDSEPILPSDIDLEEVEQALVKPADAQLVEYIENIRTCSCQPKQDVPRFEQIWTLPRSDRQRPQTIQAVGQTAG